MRAIFFDMNKTLIHFQGDAAERARQLLAKKGVFLGHDKVAEALGEARKTHDPELIQLVTDDDEREFYHRFARTFLGAADAPPRDQLVESVAQEMYDYDPLYAIYPEVPEVLGRLRAERDLVLGVISNWEPSLGRLCRYHGLDQYLDFILSSSTAGAQKPAPEIYRKALALAKVPAGAAIHVGDDYFGDVMGAKKAGIKPVWLIRDVNAEIPPEAERYRPPIINDLRDLLELVLPKAE
jgi:putative hydrolase of the HAD superfamily